MKKDNVYCNPTVIYDDFILRFTWGEFYSQRNVNYVLIRSSQHHLLIVSHQVFYVFGLAIGTGGLL